ncbi:hypothetical protein M752DRAFT_311679 [Aspergillus phoenicis ATCC 13157]|uniref:Amine oxidase domain-containing protein n=1 Tax=Aspergillus phoenicis ATCC 13157 TaxID=1353007 RepID=A0A370PTP0_ASPPH|nr:hypothetical protein M752DRAFT_311679 [Aspergillus phoenicis ATCC 13157]
MALTVRMLGEEWFLGQCLVEMRPSKPLISLLRDQSMIKRRHDICDPHPASILPITSRPRITDVGPLQKRYVEDGRDGLIAFHQNDRYDATKADHNARPEETSEIYTAVTTNATAKYFSHREEFSFDQRGMLVGSEPIRLSNEIAQDRFSVTVHSTDGECVRAKYAITTFSLGVLQHPGAVKFTPELPKWKQDAIASFEMVTYTKIFLQFPYSFWPQTQYLYYADPVERGYYPLFQPLDLPGVLEGSNILIATVVNEEAYRVEQQSEAETRSEIMEVLRKMFKDKDVPDPVDIYYARWTQEPWSYGSYSNWPPGVSARTHRHLRENVGRVLFAGEATSPQFSGFLHGAYYEGKRAAESIASCLRGPRWGDCDFSK